MGINYLNTRHATAKLITLVLSIIVAFSATYSYAASPWTTKDLASLCDLSQLNKKPLNLTGLLGGRVVITLATVHCPSIILERILVFVSWTVLAISSLLLIGCCAADIEHVNEIRHRDAFYHVFSCFVLCLASSLFIASAAEISLNECIIYNVATGTKNVNSPACSTYFLSADKFFAGAIGLVQALAFGITACILENSKLHGMTAPPMHKPAASDVLQKRVSVSSASLRKFVRKDGNKKNATSEPILPTSGETGKFWA